ncbi:MAG: histidinol-phosphatase [Erysipelotrichaceae bacterium]|nr:histidinol-phosphatase [Erysipelotrichaceae bacterium]
MKNYHTHTKRCYHAIGNEEDYILNAIKGGYTELGFSDHTPWRYDSSYHATMRMEEDKLLDYVNTLRQLKEKYKGQINIKIGLECEYFPKYMPWLQQTIKDYKLDYIILGNHYDESDEYGIYFGGELTKQQLNKYIDLCIEGLNTGLYSYLAHPDLAYYDKDIHYYKTQMKRLCQAALDTDTPLEFNLLGYKYHRHYPSKVFFELAKEMGNKVIIGSDAHDPLVLSDMQTYNKAKAYLENLGIELTEEIRFFQ